MTYLNRRIAKAQPAVVHGKIEEEIFFGTIDKIIKKSKKRPAPYWRVSYDDDDFDEIFDEQEVLSGLELYAIHKEKDPSYDRHYQQQHQQTSLLAHPLAQAEHSTSNTEPSSASIPQTQAESPRKQEKTAALPTYTARGNAPEDTSKARVKTPSRSHQRILRKTRKVFPFVVLMCVLSFGAMQNIASVTEVKSDMGKRWDAYDRQTMQTTATSSNNKKKIRLVKDDDFQQSFSACILWMDDNHRMTEWIAYHYFALPLRHVVIAVDPHSATQPTIHKQWYSLMNITIWHDTDFVQKNLTRTEDDNQDNLKHKHRARQGQFYQACARYLQNHNRTYTTFHDTDEFLTISDEFYNSKKHQNATYYASDSFKSQPGHILHLLEDYRVEPNTTAISQTHQDLSDVCMHAPRALYSAVESNEEIRQNSVPDWVDSEQFDTIRYRYRLTKRGQRDGLGKAIIDVSRLTEQDIETGGSTHRPLKSVCNKGHTTFQNYGAIPVSRLNRIDDAFVECVCKIHPMPLLSS